MKKINLERVVWRMATMFDDDVANIGIESFKGYCYDGEAFACLGLEDEDTNECVEIMEKLAPHVDALTNAIYEISEGC